MNIPKSLYDAKILWAMLRREYLDYIDKVGITGTTKSDDDDDNDDGDNSDVDTDNDIENRIQNLGLCLYSLPHVRPFMKAWMVDIKFGNEIPFGKKTNDSTVFTEEHLDDILEDPAKFTQKVGGPLIDNIEKDLTSLGVAVTDRGFGMGGGHIGCPCSDAERDAVISMVLIRYNKAVISGLIYPMVSWFKPFFNDLLMREDIDEFLG